MRKSQSILPLLALFAVPASTLAGQQRNLTAEERARMMEERERRTQEELVSERPIEAFDTVWIEEMTWMEVRDAMAAGKTTAIITTGGIEQNGPYLATGKHNYVLQGACEGVARELGNALCAPIIKLVPEGDVDEPSGHMRYPGTISLRQETFEAVLDDVASSLKTHGFEHIILFGDSGGNQSGMEAVAGRLNERWYDAQAHFIPEFYRYRDVHEWMNTELGIFETAPEGLHDDFVITAIMMVEDPAMVRYDERVAAGKASINGVPIAPKDEAVATGRKLLRFRVEETVKAIHASIAAGAAENGR
ncbi:creatininase family protein [Candidatus Palauibacter sp.]|uniref:creatininase family protein n=1 Tax=Candidatus Palauibacter sp. TaxID=3101350 RepID=UPI003B5A5BBA